MRALVLAVAVLLSASAQSQQLLRPPPPGQPTGPIPSPAPSTPAHHDDDDDYDDYDFPRDFRRRGSLVVVDHEEVVARLMQMEKLLDRAMDRSDRHTRQALRKLGNELNTLKHEVNRAPDLRAFRKRPAPPAPQKPPPPPPPPAPVVYPIADAQLQQMLHAIKRESFGDGKLRVVQAAAPTHYFLVPQVLQILQRFSFGNDKLEAVRVLWPRVLDRENAYQLYGAFTFSAEKDQLRQIIGG